MTLDRSIGGFCDCFWDLFLSEIFFFHSCLSLQTIGKQTANGFLSSQWLNTNDSDFIIWTYEDVLGRLFRITSTDGCHMVISANTLDVSHLSAPTVQSSTTGTTLPAPFFWEDLSVSESLLQKMINLHWLKAFRVRSSIVWGWEMCSWKFYRNTELPASVDSRVAKLFQLSVNHISLLHFAKNLQLLLNIQRNILRNQSFLPLLSWWNFFVHEADWPDWTEFRV